MSTVESIQKLSKFGIFRNYSSTQTQNFGRWNLFYGWNGSGKSTLSALFDALQQRSIAPSSNFADADFAVRTSDGVTLKAANVASCALNIRTFNQRFIRENIDWDKSVKGILLVAKERIDEKTALEALRLAYNAAKERASLDKKAQTELDATIQKFLSDCAKRTKSSFQVIDTSDTRYLNYDKTKLKSFIDTNEAALKDGTSVLSDSEVEKQLQSARPDQKPELLLPAPTIDLDKFTKAHDRLSDLLRTTAVNAAIDRLTTNADLQTWVERGLEVHANHKSELCEFCGSPLSEDRKKTLVGHFNDAFLKLQVRLKDAEQWLEEQRVDASAFPPESELYAELRADYKIAIGELTGAANALNEHIQMWRQTLKQKVLNQFDTTFEVRAISPESFAALTTADTAARNLLVKHNAKTENFAQQTTVSKQKLELHYAATETDAFGYFVKTQTLVEAEPKLQQAKEALVAQEQRIQQLENALSSAGSGALQFNQALHRFLGRSDLSLRFNAASSGYEIIRHDTGAHDCNLSEGEKTAVAFVYFVTKLTENDNKISDTIIVVDDPVSSFDSNHLFHAASYLRVHCKDAKQLFVLTHNFNFFKLTRDWFVTTNTNRKRKCPPKPANAFFFVIQSDSGNPRSSSIQNADKSLIEYQSEYHYLFARLHGYKAHASLSVDDAYLTANLARKLLEAFFSFKYPKGRGGDLAALLSAGQKNCTKTTVDTQERIYRFISKYSHSAYIEVDADTSENLNGESHSVIQAIFDWIKEVDPVHMQEMEEVVA